jgi:hypothetical protein
MWQCLRSTYKIFWYIFGFEQSLGLWYLSDEIDQVNFIRLPGLLVPLLLPNHTCFYQTKPQQSANIVKELDEGMDEWTIKTPNTKCRLFFKIDLLTDFAACVKQIL